jgi:endonuclease-3
VGRGGFEFVPGRRETIEQRKGRAGHILDILKILYPGATTALRYGNALELLVATILSAQCTDQRVNQVTQRLFKWYRTAADYAQAGQAQMERQICQTGFFRHKAKAIREGCAIIEEKFGGQVPETMAELTQLPGVARKTANVVLGAWFGKNEGLAVDTHVGRLSHRLALTWTSKGEKDAVKIEADLMRLIRQEQWTFVSHSLILHGRAICTARKPKCDQCKLAQHCPSAFALSNKDRKRYSRRSAN